MFNIRNIGEAFCAAGMKLFGQNVEKNLLKAARKSPEKLKEAFRPYVEEQHPIRLKMILKNHDMSREDAEEIVFDGFLALYENLRAGKFEGKSGLNAYLSAIIKNKVMRFFARDKARLWQDFADYMTDSLAYYFANRGSDHWQLIEENIQYLTQKCQRILKLFYFEGYSFKEIAPKMQLSSADSARTTKKRCLKALAERVSIQIS
ncbi:MAG: sigma-70 family RNA polymerase sigma factor [Bacteroidota bacterium]